MSNPISAGVMVCPKCGRRYPADHFKPGARYICLDDETELSRPSPSASEAQPQVTYRVTQQIQLGTLGYGERASRASSGPEADNQATRVLGSNTVASKSKAGEQETLTPSVFEERRSVLAVFHRVDEKTESVTESSKYEVLGKLGQGGVGEVLKVLDRDLKREVAMKMLLEQEGGVSEAALIRFVEEAQATGQLEHPNIVPVHDLGVDGAGRFYFTLKYVHGSSLRSVINGRNDDAHIDEEGKSFREKYTPLRMIEIMIAMCQAMAYAHSKCIIHRDLKPDNVMLGKYGEVLVMDWGLAKVLGGGAEDTKSNTIRISTSRAEGYSQVTLEGSIAGTPAYMSPEQAAGKISELTQGTDIYSLGAILYEILTGHPPYEGGSGMAIVKQVHQGPPAALRTQTGAYGFNPIPRELRAICEKAMARVPSDRYASADLLRDDLQAYIENLPVSAAPDTPLQRAAKWVKRNRRQVKSSLIGAGLVATVVLGGWFGYKQFAIRDRLHEGETKLNAARANFKAALAGAKKPTENDAYAADLWTSVRMEKENAFRVELDDVIEPLHHVLDMDPRNARARLLFAETYMELWRLAIADGNAELARVDRAEVEHYAPQPSPFAAELNGYGSVNIAVDPPDTQSYLFQFLPLRAKDKDGNGLPARLVPVPYDPGRREADQGFVNAERTRVADRSKPYEENHSIFNLAPTPGSFLGTGNVQLAQLPPGSYMLLMRASQGREIRLPFQMKRGGSVNRKVQLPEAGDVPPDFVFIAGGEAIVGGRTAGAPAVHPLNVAPAIYYHDEISMGEYSQFLKTLIASGHAAEARQRSPKDFGKKLATLNAKGDLVPVGAADPAVFSKTPVRGVSYNDALAYIAWRSKEDGLAYRLPKEWEWEAACRGADGRTYSWGDQPGKGLAVVTQGYSDTGNNISWRWQDYKDESPWGIHNMAGGVAEWTMSPYAPKAKPEDPVYGQMTIRGNAWALPPTGLECAFRTSGQPDYFHPTLGFRIALDYPIKRIGTPKASAQPIVHNH